MNTDHLVNLADRKIEDGELSDIMLAQESGAETYYLRVGGFRFPVWICDVRYCFGRRDLLVQPANGGGQRWVSDERVDL